MLKKSKVYVVTGSKVEGTAIETILNKAEEMERKVNTAPRPMQFSL